MRDITSALSSWSRWLRPKGYIAFDMPAKPFGVSQIVAQAAAAHGIILPYDVVADTVAKSRTLLEETGFEAMVVDTKVVSDEFIDVAKAVAFLNERLDHPAWRILKEASQTTRDVIHEAFIRSITENGTANRVQSIVALNFTYGRKR